ncbi:MAG: hypothetical protein Q4P66_10155, partial [Actinomycetaceae bacterium]|nr:hypothetical protein [Actinomycetaceae bacterium]
FKMTSRATPNLGNGEVTKFSAKDNLDDRNWNDPRWKDSHSADTPFDAIALPATTSKDGYLETEDHIIAVDFHLTEESEEPLKGKLTEFTIEDSSHTAYDYSYYLDGEKFENYLWQAEPVDRGTGPCEDPGTNFDENGNPRKYALKYSNDPDEPEFHYSFINKPGYEDHLHIGDSLRCYFKLPGIKFDKDTEAYHSDAINVSYETNYDTVTLKNYYHVIATSYHLSYAQYVGTYTPDQDSTILGNFDGHVAFPTLRSVDLTPYVVPFDPQTKKPVSLTVKTVIKNTGISPLSDLTIKWDSSGWDGWELKDFGCPSLRDGYKNASIQDNYNSEEPDTIGNLSIDFNNEELFKPGEFFECEATLAFTHDDPPTDAIQHNSSVEVTTSKIPQSSSEQNRLQSIINFIADPNPIKVEKYFDERQLVGGDTTAPNVVKLDADTFDTAARIPTYVDKDGTTRTQSVDIFMTLTNTKQNEELVAFVLFDEDSVDDKGVPLNNPATYRAKLVSCNLPEGFIELEHPDFPGKKAYYQNDNEKPGIKFGESITCTMTLPSIDISKLKDVKHGNDISVLVFNKSFDSRKSTTDSAYARPVHATASVEQFFEAKDLAGGESVAPDADPVVADSEDKAAVLAVDASGATPTTKQTNAYFTVTNTGDSEVTAVDIEYKSLLGQSHAISATEVVCTSGKGDLSPSSTVVTDPVDRTKVSITLNKDEPLSPGESFTCHAVLPATSVTANAPVSFKGEVHIKSTGETNTTIKEVTAPIYAKASIGQVSVEKYFDGRDLVGGNPKDTTLAKVNADDHAHAAQIPTVLSEGKPVTKQTPVYVTVTNSGKKPLKTVTLRDTPLTDATTAGFDAGNWECAAGANGIGEYAKASATSGKSHEMVVSFPNDHLFKPNDTFTCQMTLPSVPVTPGKTVTHANTVTASAQTLQDENTQPATNSAYAKASVGKVSITQFFNGNELEGGDPSSATIDHVEAPDAAHAARLAATTVGGVSTTRETKAYITVKNSGDHNLSSIHVSYNTLTSETTPGFAAKNLSCPTNDGNLPEGTTVKPVSDTEVLVNFPDDALFSPDSSFTCHVTLPATTIGKGSDLSYAGTASIQAVDALSQPIPSASASLYANAAAVEMPAPSSQAFKYASLPGSSDNKSEQRANNSCSKPAEQCSLDAGKKTSTVTMDFTNTSDEVVENLSITDVTTAGKPVNLPAKGVVGILAADGSLTSSRTVYYKAQGSNLSVWNDSALTKQATLASGETLRVEASLSLDVAKDTQHGDTVTFRGSGVTSGKEALASDSYYVLIKAPPVPDKNPSENP